MMIAYRSLTHTNHTRSPRTCSPLSFIATSLSLPVCVCLCVHQRNINILHWCIFAWNHDHLLDYFNLYHYLPLFNRLLSTFSFLPLAFSVSLFNASLLQITLFLSCLPVDIFSPLSTVHTCTHHLQSSFCHSWTCCYARRKWSHRYSHFSCYWYSIWFHTYSTWRMVRVVDVTFLSPLLLLLSLSFFSPSFRLVLLTYFIYFLRLFFLFLSLWHHCRFLCFFSFSCTVSLKGKKTSEQWSSGLYLYPVYSAFAFYIDHWTFFLSLLLSLCSLSHSSTSLYLLRLFQLHLLFYPFHWVKGSHDSRERNVTTLSLSLCCPLEEGEEAKRKRDFTSPTVYLLVHFSRSFFFSCVSHALTESSRYFMFNCVPFFFSLSHSHSLRIISGLIY